MIQLSGLPQVGTYITQVKGQKNVAPEEEILRTPIAVRRSSRITKPQQKYSPSLYYILLAGRDELERYEEAVQGKDSVKWELKMKIDMNSLMLCNTCQLTKLPRG